MSKNLKSQTISALVWNTLDKVFTQLCYAVTGIVLANILLVEDFGVVGILTVFTAFANVFIDGGFSNALIQKKTLGEKDKSTVFFFNFLISILFYILLYVSIPLIAHHFEDERLVMLSRVMFLNLFFLSFGIIQSSILMREMNIRKLSIINAVSLSFSSVIALVMALNDLGVWALVAQTLGYSVCRSAVLWLTSKWRPQFIFSIDSFRSFVGYGSHIFLTNLVSTFFQNIYTFVIGMKYKMKDLGYYSQADKWSKMGTTGLSQIIGFSVFPALASIQDDNERMQRVFGKMNRMTSYLSFPVFTGLIIVAQPLFNAFFGTKWDASVLLFQLLIVRGLFFVYTSLLNNYIMATGKSRVIFYLEIIKDIIAIVALLITIPISIPALVIGQVIAGGIHYAISTVFLSRYTGYKVKRQLADMAPYLAISLVMAAILIVWNYVIDNTYLLLTAQIITGALVYFTLNKLLNSRIQQEALNIILRRKSENSDD